MAREAQLDLVEISPQAEPPVVQIMDFGKFLYEQHKKEREAKKAQKIIEVKEIQLRPNIDDHDYQTKMKAVNRFLDEGDRVKVTLRFRGREMAHQEFGVAQLKRVETDMQELGVVEQFPKLEGRQMVMVLSPKKKK